MYEASSFLREFALKPALYRGSSDFLFHSQVEFLSLTHSFSLLNFSPGFKVKPLLSFKTPSCLHLHILCSFCLMPNLRAMMRPWDSYIIIHPTHERNPYLLPFQTDHHSLPYLIQSAFMFIIFNWKFIQYSLIIVSVPPFPPRSSPPSHLPTHLASVCFHLHFLTQDVSPNPKLTIEIDWWHGALKILLSLYYWNSRSALPYPVLSGCWRPKLSSLVLCGSPFASESVSQTVDSSLFVLSQEYFQPSPWFLLLWFPKCP